MKVTTYYPEKEYPYLAVWVGRGGSLDVDFIHNIKKENIVLVSMVEVEGSDKQPYALDM